MKVTYKKSELGWKAFLDGKYVCTLIKIRKMGSYFWKVVGDKKRGLFAKRDDAVLEIFWESENGIHKVNMKSY